MENLKIPENYRESQSMPGDPKGSSAFGFIGNDSTNAVVIFEDEQIMPYDDQKGVVHGLRRTLEDNKGVVEAENGITKSGKRFVYTIVKVLQVTGGAPAGVLYNLNMQIENGNSATMVQGYFAEQGATGKRESAVYSELKNTPNINENWSKDPYDENFKFGILKNISENREYDENFPDHPLTQARKFVEFVAENN